eukprot:gene2230-1391_t
MNERATNGERGDLYMLLFLFCELVIEIKSTTLLYASHIFQLSFFISFFISFCFVHPFPLFFLSSSRTVKTTTTTTTNNQKLKTTTTTYEERKHKKYPEEANKKRTENQE